MASRAWACILVFQSTRPAWGRDLLGRFAWLYLREGSIHAPRAGARHVRLAGIGYIGQVSIHAPRQGARPGLARARSEEHTPELQSRGRLACRFLLDNR